MEFSKKQAEIAQRLSEGAIVYQKAFVNEKILREQFQDSRKALICFLDKYAYERQGAAPSYPKIAIKTIEKISEGSTLEKLLARKDIASDAWEEYCEIAEKDFHISRNSKRNNELKVNARNNPMNFDNGVLSFMVNYRVSNLAEYTRDLIVKDRIADAHQFIKSIRGVGTKIASFYIRDISYLERAHIREENIKNVHLLQPIDTWLNKTLQLIFGNDVKTKGIVGKQHLIVDLCKKAGCSSIEFNQGAWVFGSQIAEKDNEIFSKFVKGINIREILKGHVTKKRTYIECVEKLLSAQSS